MTNQNDITPDPNQFPGLTPEEIKLVQALREKKARKTEAARQRRATKAAVPAGSRGQVMVRGIRRPELDTTKLSLALWLIAKDEAKREAEESKDGTL